MTEVGRVVIVASANHGWACRSVECAVRADGSSPAGDYWRGLSTGTWEDDPRFTAPPDDDQIHDAYMFIAKLEYLARLGYPRGREDVKHLIDGIWEVRHHHHRFAFYDTSGDGTWEPKLRAEDWNEVDPQRQSEDFWWFPHMEGVLRLTNAWPKTEQRAPVEALELAQQIREEDAAHDAA